MVRFVHRFRYLRHVTFAIEVVYTSRLFDSVITYIYHQLYEIFERKSNFTATQTIIFCIRYRRTYILSQLSKKKKKTSILLTIFKIFIIFEINTFSMYNKNIFKDQIFILISTINIPCKIIHYCKTILRIIGCNC